MIMTSMMTALTLISLPKRKRKPLRRLAKRPPPSISRAYLKGSFKNSSAKRSMS
jgi:hypothetical protein